MAKAASSSSHVVALWWSSARTAASMRSTAAIRRMPQFSSLPIVFLTAKAMPGDRESSFAAGASDYITKPVDLDELIELMARWVNASEGGTARG